MASSYPPSSCHEPDESSSSRASDQAVILDEIDALTKQNEELIEFCLSTNANLRECQAKQEQMVQIINKLKEKLSEKDRIISKHEKKIKKLQNKMFTEEWNSNATPVERTPERKAKLSRFGTKPADNKEND